MTSIDETSNSERYSWSFSPADLVQSSRTTSDQNEFDAASFVNAIESQMYIAPSTQPTATPSLAETSLQISPPETAATNSDTEQHAVDTSFGSIKHLSQWIPNIDPPSQNSKFTYYSKRREFVLWTSFGIVCAVFVTNLVLTILVYVLKLTKYGPIVTIHQSNCDFINRLDTSLHLIINILSTLMLGASSLCMQLASAPTRAQINTAHKKGQWTDIGVPSFKNLRFISWQSALIWFALVVSSTPIHFLYNSVVFTSFAGNNIIYAVVSNTFLTGPAWDFVTNVPDPAETYNVTLSEGYWELSTNTFRIDPENPNWHNLPSLHNDYIANPTSYVNVSTFDCMVNSSQSFHWRPNTIMVTSEPDHTYMLNGSHPHWTHNGSLLDWGFNVQTQNTLFSGLCLSFRDHHQNFFPYPGCNDISTIDPSTIGNFNFGRFRYKIDYCLLSTEGIVPDLRSEVEACHLLVVPMILCVVTGFNLIKCICVGILIYHNRKVDTIATIGDAVANFLETPDPTTKYLGRTTKSFVMSHRPSGKRNPGTAWTATSGEGYLYPWDASRWRKAASLRRWILVNVACFIVLLGALALMGQGFQTVHTYSPRSLSYLGLKTLGWGNLNTLELIAWADTNSTLLAIIINVLSTNFWQVIISYLYFAQNALLTSFLVADEWARFALQRKSLRVSTPKGIQRSTYMLSLPLRYSLPMQLAFALLHYFVSQSTFVVGIQMFNTDDVPPWQWTTAGFSLLPIIASAGMATAILFALVSIAFSNRLADSPMPLVSSCSVAISAACHPPADDKDAYLLPVQWGIVGEKDENGASRCAFTTSLFVRPPTSNDLVLGTPDEEEKIKDGRLAIMWRRVLRRKVTVNEKRERESEDIESTG